MDFVEVKPPAEKLINDSFEALLDLLNVNDIGYSELAEIFEQDEINNSGEDD